MARRHRPEAIPTRSARDPSVAVVLGIAAAIHVTWLAGNEVFNGRGLVFYRLPSVDSAVHQLLPFAAEAGVALAAIAWLGWWRPVGLVPAEPTRISPSFVLPSIAYLVLFFLGVAELAAAGAITVGMMTTMVLVFGVTAFTEEIVFRGFLLHGLTARLGVPLAVAISSALFGLIHYVPYRGIDWLGFLSLFGFGVLMCRIRMTTGSVWYPYVAHLFANFSWTVLFWLTGLDQSERLAWFAWKVPGLAGLLIFVSIVLAALLGSVQRVASERTGGALPASTFERNYRNVALVLGGGSLVVLLGGIVLGNLVERSPAVLVLASVVGSALFFWALHAVTSLRTRRAQLRHAESITSDVPVLIEPMPMTAAVADHVTTLGHLGFVLVGSGRRADLASSYAILLDGEGIVTAEVVAGDASPGPARVVLSSVLLDRRGVLETSSDARDARLWEAQLVQAFPDAGPGALLAAHRQALRFLDTRGVTPDVVRADELVAVLTWARREMDSAIARTPARRFRDELVRSYTMRSVGPLEADPDIADRLARFWLAVDGGDTHQPAGALSRAAASSLEGGS